MQQTDDKVMKILGVKDIKRLICNTDKGVLELVIRKGDNDYFLTLDAVPLDKDVEKELKEVLFPKKESFVPQVAKQPPLPVEQAKVSPDTVSGTMHTADEITVTTTKKVGRPAKQGVN